MAVLAYHLVLTAYGFWLPNDPRGSWSQFVRAFEIYREGGSATRTDTRRSVADAEHDHAARQRAKRALRYRPVIFTGVQAREIARALGEYVDERKAVIHAASLMPDHVHLVVARSGRKIEQVASQLKMKATARLAKAALHPMPVIDPKTGRRPSPWARNQWAVYLDSHDDVRRAIHYVNDNPINVGLRAQSWRWVAPYEP